MNRYKLPMWQRQRKVSLLDILEIIGDQGTPWSILYFFGVGRPPPKFISDSVVEFEGWLMSHETGYLIDWKELILFAENIDDLVDIDLISFDEVGGYHSFNIHIEGFDSGEWCILSRSPIAGL